MHRFFLTDRELEIDERVDLQPLAHQLTRVLRQQPGSQIVVLDNRGYEFRVVIERLSPGAAVGRALTKQAVRSEPNLHLTLYQCSLKADKFEWVLQKCTELGVTRFVPVISQRSVVRPAAKLLKKYDRWRTIVREAAEQSGRGRLPELLPPLEWDKAIGQGEGCRVLPWEEAQTGRSLGAVVSSWPTAKNTNLLIGPEGGLTGEEVDAARAVGWQIASLGPRILRAETAAIVSATIIMERAGQLAA